MIGKNSQSGFAVVETLLVVVILAILGGTGYFVWHARQNANDSLSNAANSQQGIVKASKVTDFASCKAASGSKMLETYPEQCVTKDGKKFSDTQKLSSYNLSLEKVSFQYDPSIWTVSDRQSGSGQCGTTDSVRIADNKFNLNIGFNNVGCGKGGGDCGFGVECKIETKQIDTVKVSNTDNYNLLARRISTDAGATWQYEVFLYGKAECSSLFCFVNSKNLPDSPLLSEMNGSFQQTGSGGANTLDQYVALPAVQAAIAVLKTVHY